MSTESVRAGIVDVGFAAGVHSAGSAQSPCRLGIDGAQLLSHIRNTQAFKETPVIVLTSSDSPKDRELALRLGASIYFRKPTDLTSFMMLGRVIQETAQKARESAI